MTFAQNGPMPERGCRLPLKNDEQNTEQQIQAMLPESLRVVRRLFALKNSGPQVNVVCEIISFIALITGTTPC